MSKSKKSRAEGIFSLRSMIIMAMLIAMTVMLDRVPGLSIKTPGWKIGFSFVPPMIAAMLLGPVQSAIVYGLSDLIGALLFPFGPYHPGFTVVAALMGFIMGVFLNKRPFAFAGSDREWKKIRFFPNMVVPVVVNCLLLGLVVNTFWVSQLYGSKTYAGWFVYRLLEYAILVPVQLVLIPVLLRLCELLKKAGVVGFSRTGAARERLSSISRNESILGLSRITELLSLLGDPQEKVPAVHVSGTNGKGSFTAMLASVLKAAGNKVGAFTSPAITGVTDGIRVNGERIGEEELDSLLAEIAPFAGRMAEKPTEFEVMTAAAYLYFAREGCDISVIECGLGGAGDSTNVLKSPLLSVITNVELDHTDRLGKTLSAIAEHKAGVIKEGRPVLYGGDPGEALEVIERRAEEMGSRLFITDRTRLTAAPSTLSGTDIEFAGFPPMHLSLLGEYQPANAASVLTAVEILRGEGVGIPDSAAAYGLSHTSWPARFELISQEPCVIFDGSHNPDGVKLAASSIEHIFEGKKAVILMGVMADKEYAKYPAMLKNCAGKVFAVKPANPRSLRAEALAACFAGAGVPAEAFADFEEGVRAAYAEAREKQAPLVAMGTLYMYKEFTEALGKLIG